MRGARPILRLGLVTGALLAALACKREEEPPAYPTPPVVAQGPAPGTWQQGNPAGPAQTLPPAQGLPCSSDRDMQCPFARCGGGRCGGCVDGTQCKPGSQCLPTWFGMACVPAATPGPLPPPQAPPPVAQPAPVPQAPAPSPPPPVAADPAASSPDAVTRARARCVQRINDYRARVGAAPLARNAGREACVDQQAQSDAGTRRAHGAFGRCGEMAQNECPGWPGSLDSVVDGCLEMMFKEGPGGGHYDNMTDRRKSSAACGVFTTSRGEVWMVHDFFR